MNGAYVNDGLSCSSINISAGAQTPSQTNSSECILTNGDGKNEQEHNALISRTKEWMKTKMKQACTKKSLHKRIPILTWLPKYSSGDAIGDLMAGITVGLTVIPQALAYSGIAGLPAAYGLYGSFIGCFVYIILGSCKDVPMGPTAISAILTFQSARGSVPKAILLSLFTGIIELLMATFGLGFLVNFVSGPVSSGFTSAVALIIVTSQVKDILGVSAKGSTFFEIWISTFKNIGDIKYWDFALGVTCIAFLLIFRIIANVKVGTSEQISKSKLYRSLNKIMWIVGTSRNAILVIICGYLGYVFEQNATAPFRIIGDIPPGLPAVQAPPFSLSAEESATGEPESFTDMISSLGSGLIVVPLIALMEDIAICKAFANGKTVDATQELIAIGASNIANSFFQGFPITGSLSRSAINNSSGVRTPLGGLYTGLLVIVSLLFFTPFFRYIPKAALAAVIISAVIFMVEVKVIKPMWRSKKTDLVPGLGSFFACLIFPLEIGILIGLAINMSFILYHAARPKVTIEVLTTTGGNEYLMITLDRCLLFPSAEYVRSLVNKQSVKRNLPVVIDCSHVYGSDYTAATVITNITKDFSQRRQVLLFYNLKPSVCSIFEGLSPTDFVIFYNEEMLDQHLREQQASLGIA